MDKLNIGVELRDFDLERMGFSLSVLDEKNKRRSSEAYLRMTLSEMNTFLKALKAAPDEIDVSTVESIAARNMRGAAAPSAPSERLAANREDDDRGFLSRAIEEKIAADVTARRGATPARARPVKA
jgi:hypothetical protein